MVQTIAAKLLLEARDRRVLSQRDLAEAAGTSQSVVGRIEAGLASPSIETLIRLVGAAGFEIRLELEPKRMVDPVIEAYKPGIDQTLLIENLRRTVEERLRINIEFNYFGEEVDRTRLKRVAEPEP